MKSTGAILAGSVGCKKVALLVGYGLVIFSSPDGTVKAKDYATK